MRWVSGKADNGECACAKNLGTQLPLKGCDSQHYAPTYFRECWKGAMKEVGP